MLSDSHRNKLLQWLISNGMAMIIVAGCEFVTWFVALPSMARRGHSLDVFSVAGYLGTNLEVYPMMFFPILAWHLIDLFDGRRRSSSINKIVSSYRCFFLMLSVFGASVIVLQTRYFHAKCDTIRNKWAFSCVESPPPWLQGLCYLLWTALIMVVVGKLVLFVASTMKARD